MSRRNNDRVSPRHGARLARRGGAGALAAAIVALLAGCAPSGAADSANAEVAAYLPEQNIDRWVMPLDQYMVTYAQSQRESYAISLMTQECLDGQGFVHTVPAMSFVDDPNDLGIRDVFSPEVVSVSGYHSPGVLREQDAAWSAYSNRQMSDAEVSAVDKCVTGILDGGFVRYDNQVLNFASGIAQAAFSGSLQDPEVKKTAKAWRECLAPQGIEDLPDDPSSMPSESISKRFGLSASPDSGTTLGVSADEIELALADADCRESSGYEQARYNAEWSRQVTLLSENLDALEAAKSKISDIDSSISDVIASHAPTE